MVKTRPSLSGASGQKLDFSHSFISAVLVFSNSYSVVKVRTILCLLLNEKFAHLLGHDA